MRRRQEISGAPERFRAVSRGRVAGAAAGTRFPIAADEPSDGPQVSRERADGHVRGVSGPVTSDPVAAEDTAASDVVAELEDARNVLVAAPAIGAARHRACAELLGTTPAEDTNALAVTYGRSAERWLADYDEHAAAFPRHLVVVSVGERQRSTQGWSEGGTTTQPLVPHEPVVDTVEDPHDLTGLGIVLSEYLRDFDEQRFESGPTAVACCFDSITALLQYADPDRVYQFLHVVTDRAARLDATAHYHVDPAAHDEQTLATLRSLFDAQVDATAGPDPETWTVSRRR